MEWTFANVIIQTVAGLIGSHIAAAAAHEHRFGLWGHTLVGLVERRPWWACPAKIRVHRRHGQRKPERTDARPDLRVAGADRGCARRDRHDGHRPHHQASGQGRNDRRTRAPTANHRSYFDITRNMVDKTPCGAAGCHMKLDDAAAHLEALGNPTRLKIYRTLVRAGNAGLAVGRLQDKLKIAPSTLSHHIKTTCGGRTGQPGAGFDHAGVSRELRCDAGTGRFSGRRMLHRCRGGRRQQGRVAFLAIISIFLVL